MTPSFKYPFRNPQHPPSPWLMLSQPNHVRSWSNFQDRPLSNYQPDLWCQRWPHPSILQSGTFNILQAPNLYFLSKIMSDLDQIFRKGPLATTNLIYDVKDDPFLQVSIQEPSTSSKPPTYAFSAKSWRIFTKLSEHLWNHLWRWSMMSKMISSFKSPIRNPQCPPSPQLRLPQPNLVQSW